MNLSIFGRHDENNMYKGADPEGFYLWNKTFLQNKLQNDWQCWKYADISPFLPVIFMLYYLHIHYLYVI